MASFTRAQTLLNQFGNILTEKENKVKVANIHRSVLEVLQEAWRSIPVD